MHMFELAAGDTTLPETRPTRLPDRSHPRANDMVGRTTVWRERAETRELVAVEQHADGRILQVGGGDRTLLTNTNSFVRIHCAAQIDGRFE